MQSTDFLCSAVQGFFTELKRKETKCYASNLFEGVVNLQFTIHSWNFKLSTKFKF